MYEKSIDCVMDESCVQTCVDNNKVKIKLSYIRHKMVSKVFCHQFYQHVSYIA